MKYRMNYASLILFAVREKHRRWSDCVITQAGLYLCFSHAVKSGFQTSRPIFNVTHIYINTYFQTQTFSVRYMPQHILYTTNNNLHVKLYAHLNRYFSISQPWHIHIYYKQNTYGPYKCNSQINRNLSYLQMKRYTHIYRYFLISQTKHMALYGHN